MGPAHLAVAFVAKPAAPKAPLWGLLVTSEVLDLLCFGFLALGVENTGVVRSDPNQGISIVVMPSIAWSHGLFMAVVWSMAAGAGAYLFLRNRRASLAVGLVVISHWLLDFIVHPGELPLLFNGSPTVGLGLWTTSAGMTASYVLEALLLAGGIAIYFITRKQKPDQKTARFTAPVP